ncbi:hypothetical protein D3C85_851840 [compost metagenome]
MSIFFLVPYPITTTSFKAVSSASFKVIVIGAVVAGTETASKPSIETFKTSPSLALIVKLPSKSASAVVLEVGALITAPGIPIPLLSTIFPLIACPDIYAGNSKSAKKLKIKFFIQFVIV